MGLLQGPRSSAARASGQGLHNVLITPTPIVTQSQHGSTPRVIQTLIGHLSMNPVGPNRQNVYLGPSPARHRMVTRISELPWHLDIGWGEEIALIGNKSCFGPLKGLL